MKDSHKPFPARLHLTVNKNLVHLNFIFVKFEKKSLNILPQY